MVSREDASARADDAKADAITDASRSTVDIYNFDHRITSPWSFWFGPYRFHVRAEHIDPGILAHSGGHHFSHQVADDSLEFEVTETPALAGAWRPTAVIEDVPDLSVVSRMLPEIPGRTESDDLALILSFLTGRDVTIGNGAQQHDWLHSGEPIVVGTYFYRPYLDWSVLPTLEASGAADAMHVICLAMASPNMMTKFALGSAALDRLSGGWFGSSGTSMYNAAVRAKVATARPELETVLRAAGLSEDLVADITPRISGLCNDSAVAKLRAFLIAHDMFPAAPDAKSDTRLTLLNKHRNAVLHRATIHVVSQTTFEANAQIAGAVAFLILMICRVYVSAHLLKIEGDTYGIEKDRQTVKTFFATGRFRDHDVFGESYAQYLARQHEAWTVGGDFPA